jgi:hypothetical protein
MNTLLEEQYHPNNEANIKLSYFATRRAKRQIRAIINTLQLVRQEEWVSSKNHLIRIGKYGAVAKMIHPKQRAGPTTGKFYPTKPMEPTRQAINNRERMEATLITHCKWMDNPPGKKNCIFLDTTADEVGVNGITVNPEKPFDDTAQWEYLEGMLEEKTNIDIANRVRLAHDRLPVLFRQFKTDRKLTYPFKYDCINGRFIYPELESKLRKNAASGNGKARATGFTIPVLGRQPKIYLDKYLIKCKLQLTLRLLDTGTECSLRICIGKPCGGVRPLTVGHDDNVFLNGIAQQAIQQEIANYKILPESYQKGKSCADATIVDAIVKESAIQYDDYYLAKLSDDAEKMFNHLYLELQIALLLLAGAGIQGITEWQSANMLHRTNKLITDIFVALLQYRCRLPQGNGFSVEVANLYAMLLLL